MNSFWLIRKRGLVHVLMGHLLREMNGTKLSIDVTLKCLKIWLVHAHMLPEGTSSDIYR